MEDENSCLLVKTVQPSRIDKRSRDFAGTCLSDYEELFNPVYGMSHSKNPRMSELQIDFFDAKQGRKDRKHHDPNEKRSERQLIGVGKHEAAPVIELERVGRGIITSHSARRQTCTGASGSLSSTGHEEHGWQRQTVEFYDALNQVLYRYLRGLGLGAETTEDVTQETFLRVAAHLRDGGNAENLRAWIFQVAYNLSMDVYRVSRRDHGETDQTQPHNAEQVDPAANPERAYLENERLYRLKHAMNQLTQRQRSSILLRAEGLRYREIASVLGVSEQRAIHLVKRGLARLSEEL